MQLFRYYFGLLLFGALLCTANASAQALLDDAALVPYADVLKQLRYKLPAKAQLINNPSVDSWSVYGPAAEKGWINTSSQIGGKALSVKIMQAGEQAWSVGAQAPILAAIRKGDTLLLAYQVRASSADNEAQSGLISANRIERKTPPYTGLVEGGAQISDEWTMVYAAGVAGQSFAAGETQVSLHLASTRQTLELGNAYVFNLGPDIDLTKLPKLHITYPGRALDAPWRTAAQERIDKIRKTDIHVTVRNASGQALANVPVEVSMLRHSFHFGAFVGHQISADTPEASKQRASFPSLFNTATSPLYWHDWGWQNALKRQQYVESMQYLHNNNIAWRGHTLIYPAQDSLPKQIKDLEGDTAAFKNAVLKHVDAVMKVAAPYQPFAMDVINEPRDGSFTIDRIGLDGVAEAFRIAHAAAPGVDLFVNDYGIISNGGRNQRNIAFYHDFLRKLQVANAPVSGIGIQGHFGAVLTDPARVLEIFDEFAQYNMPIHITEFDVDTADEQTQADFTRDMLIAAFSHPGVKAFMTWGWWEGDHWRPSAAMLRKDWSEKPNYAAWRKLVFQDWWTQQSLSTNQAGTVSLRGFQGDYEINAKVNGKTITRKVRADASGLKVDIVTQ
jgi:endo-1,4-beta-xylanase